jgi:hypothetical protein
MQNFMPGTQPRGTHAFNPSSSQSATQMLNVLNAEEDGAEDQVGPPLDSPMSNMPAASLVPPDFSTNLSGGTSSAASSLPLPNPNNTSSSSGSTKPPPPSSLPPTIYPHPTQERDVSMGSVYSITTGSDASSNKFRKRKRDATASGIKPPSSKRSSKSTKTSDLNPVIISNALNSTLNRIVDVMERTLDATAPTTAPTTSVAPPSIVTSPIDFQTAQLSSSHSNPSSASVSSTEILDQAIRIVSADDSGFSEDELLSASLFFTSASEDAIRAARTFVALGNNKVVQHKFLLRQLDTAALLPGRSKAKAAEPEDEHFMMYE